MSRPSPRRSSYPDAALASPGRRLRHIFVKVLDLPFAADADVAIKEDVEELRSVAVGEDVVLRHFTPWSSWSPLRSEELVAEARGDAPVKGMRRGVPASYRRIFGRYGESGCP